jgi:hypothetical protein
MLKIRCSALGNIMTNGRSKDDAALSVGAKTYIEDLAKQHVYGYTKQVNTKAIQKGIIVEDQSIALVNQVLFTSHTKNQERRENRWIGGTCDIFTGTAIHDIKSSWSLDTFPATVKDAEDNGYEWQIRGYMALWNVDQAEVDYTLVDTPDELIGFEDEAAHHVSHIDPSLRITRVCYERDKALEQLIAHKAEAAQRYFIEAVEAIRSTHANY